MKLLIVVDVQNDFVNGSLGSFDAQAIIPNVINKVKDYEFNKYPILYTRDTHNHLYSLTQEGKRLPVSHCVYGTDGWKIVSEVYTPNRSYIMDKTSFGSDVIPEVVSNIMLDCEKAIDEIEIIGLCTDICVISNALILKAFFPEILISCDSTCCAGVTPAKHAAALDVMRSCQIDVY